VGFKLEFILLKQSLEVYVLAVSGTLAMHRLCNKHLPLLEKSVMAIHDADIYTCKFYAEFGPAQFKVATGLLPPTD
jgi:hypothetical protein